MDVIHELSVGWMVPQPIHSMGAITLNCLCPLPPSLSLGIGIGGGERETASAIVAFFLYAGNKFELPIPTVTQPMCYKYTLIL